jgi:divalent metal cation (Fe/Co/Zn/Cd) transporter
MEQSNSPCETAESLPRLTAVLWLQAVTVIWMLIECGVSLLAAARAHSPALLAFGSDSLVELLSASLVLLQFTPPLKVSKKQAAKAAAVLLFALAAIVTLIAGLSLAGHVQPESSFLGIGLTVIALLVMPVLGWLKRKEARLLNNPALAADAVQSATCAYLAGITLIGLGLNAAFHIGCFDSVAALIAVPLLLKEGGEAWHGRSCCC